MHCKNQTQTVVTRRIHDALVTTILLVSLAPIGNAQVQTISRDHQCEGGGRWGAPPCESAWRPDITAIFFGLATHVQEEDVPIISDGEKALTSRQHVTFRVDETFMGVSEKVINVTSGGDLCGFPFSKGRKYLVYGRRLPNGEVYVSISSSTKSEKEASDDLKYLRGLPNAPHGATIYGSIFRYASPENPRVAMVIRPGILVVGQKIQVQGGGQTFEAISDGHGNFKLAGLPPGRYTVVLNAEGEIHISPPKSMTVDVADKGCARFDFWIDPFAKRDSRN